MRRVLVVDDDPHVSRLSVPGWYNTVSGLRLPTAAPTVSPLSTTRFAIIVGVFMPNMRGFESIGLFHQRAPSAPLIAISGCAFSNLDISGADFPGMAAKLGATRCLRKPFRQTTLLDVIDQCLSEAQPHRRFAATLSAVTHDRSGTAMH